MTYKIKYKYPDCNFSNVFYRISNRNIPMAEIVSELKKGDAGFKRVIKAKDLGRNVTVGFIHIGMCIV